MENSELITIVIPVKGNDDALRYSLILEPSLKKLNAQVLVVTDEDLDNSFSDSNFDLSKLSSGWVKQQYIKLAISKYIKTPWYLCLDSDCFFTTFENIDDLFLSKDRNTAFYNDETGSHSEWWKLSSKFLSLPIPEQQCGVTPMMLKTSLCEKLLTNIGHKNIKKFLERGATEYTLYWTYNLPYSHYTKKNISYGVYPQVASLNCFVQNPDCYDNISNQPWHDYPIGLIQSTMKHNPFLLKKAINKIYENI